MAVADPTPGAQQGGKRAWPQAEHSGRPLGAQQRQTRTQRGGDRWRTLACSQLFQSSGAPAAPVERPFRQPGAASSAPAVKAEAPKPKKVEESGSDGLDPRSVALPGACALRGGEKMFFGGADARLQPLGRCWLLCPAAQRRSRPSPAWALPSARWTTASPSGSASRARSSGWVVLTQGWRGRAGDLSTSEPPSDTRHGAAAFTRRTRAPTLGLRRTSRARSLQRRRARAAPRRAPR